MGEAGVRLGKKTRAMEAIDLPRQLLIQELALKQIAFRRRRRLSRVRSFLVKLVKLFRV